MTRHELLIQMAKVAQNPEAKKAVEEAATPQEMIKAAALAGVVLTEEDLQEVAAEKEEHGELREEELASVAAGGETPWARFEKWFHQYVLDLIMSPFYEWEKKHK